MSYHPTFVTNRIEWPIRKDRIIEILQPWCCDDVIPIILSYLNTEYDWDLKKDIVREMLSQEKYWDKGTCSIFTFTNNFTRCRLRSSYVKMIQLNDGIFSLWWEYMIEGMKGKRASYIQVDLIDPTTWESLHNLTICPTNLVCIKSTTGALTKSKWLQNLKKIN